MILFLSWDSDASKQMHQAQEGNEPETARRLSQSIEQANRIIESWLITKGGKLIGYEGGSGTAEIDAEHLGDVQDLREQYAKAINDGAVWMGIGTELKEALVAKEAAVKRGGQGEIILYTPEIAQELNEAEADNQADTDDLFGDGMTSDDVLLGKAEGEAQMGEATAVERGQAAPPSPMSPMSQGASQLPSIPAPGGEQPQPAPGAPQNQQQLRQAIVGVLKGIRGQVQFFEKVKEQNPKAYEAVMGLVEAMLQLAKQVLGPQAPTEQDAGIAKSERFLKLAEYLAKTNPELGLKLVELSKAVQPLAKMAKIHDNPTKPMMLWRVQNAKGEGPYMAHNPPDMDFPEWADHGQPDPIDDFPEQDQDQANYNANGGPGLDWFEGKPQRSAAKRGEPQFAFLKPEDATQWFGHEGLAKLKAQGFGLAQVPAAKAWMSSSGKQVMYHPATKAKVAKPVAAMAKDELPGGIADDSDPKQFPKDLLREGAEHEMEHTDDPQIAAEIAMDHLKEDPLYYRKLKAVGMEKEELDGTVRRDISAQLPNPEIKKGALSPKLHLPVGSVLNGTGRSGGNAQTADTGKVKEINASGSEVWRQERRGRRAAVPDQEGGSSKSAQIKVPPTEVGPATEKRGTAAGDGQG